MSSHAATTARLPVADAAPGVVMRDLKLVLGFTQRRAFLAMPESATWSSSVVVVGDSRELDDCATDVARRFAVAGHGALAIGHGDEEPEGTPPRHLTRWIDLGLARLRSEAPAPPARSGVVGFGKGGFLALVAGYRSHVGAAVSLYGDGPKRLSLELRRIIDRPKRHAAPFLFLLGGEDEAVRPDDLAAIHERLDTFGMRHTFIIYPRTRSGFCRVGTSDHRATEAADAWARATHALESASRLRNRSPPGTKGSSRA